MENHSHLLRVICSLIFALALVVSLVAPTEAEKDIPHTTLGSGSFGTSSLANGATMSFFYCYSCGYRKAFEEYVSILTEKYPEITVRGANYDPPGLNMYLSKGVLITKLILMFVLMSGFDIWGYIGQAIPGWWQWCTQNKIYACMMIFFVGNMIEGHLVSSGAFEISFNDVPVWSKLQSGRIPAPQELFQIIENQLKFTQPMDEHPNFVK